MADYHTFREWPKTTFKRTGKPTFKKPKKPKARGGQYDPCTMRYDGLTGYYGKTGIIAPTPNLITGVFRFTTNSQTGGGVQTICWANGVGTQPFLNVYVGDSDHANTDIRDKLVVITRDNGGTDLCALISDVTVTDGSSHVGFYAYDGVNGTAIFVLDGSDADDTGNASRVAPVVGNPNSGTGAVSVGSNSAGFASELFDGDVSFFGYRHVYLTNWSDFMKNNGNPKELDEIGWTEWGSQPEYWNAAGEMDDNKGTLASLDRFGTVQGPYCPGGIDDPTDIANLALWLDGDDSTVIFQNNTGDVGSNPVTADGQTVANWTDKSGNLNNVFQDGGNNRPTYKTGIQNGLPVLRSINAAQDDWLERTSSVLTQTVNVTIFYVAAATGDETIGVVYSNADTSTLELAAALDSRTANRLGAQVVDSTGAANANNPADIGTEFNQFTSVLDGSNVTARLNGAAGTPVAFAGDGVTTNDYTRVFNQRSDFTTLFGDVAELIVYDGALSAEDIGRVEAYLKAKWNTP